MPDEELQLSDKEKEAIQRLADTKKMQFDDVLETIAVDALMSAPRDEEPQE
jgi:hypothetical protein